jgi:hypothetical protein
MLRVRQKLSCRRQSDGFFCKNPYFFDCRIVDFSWSFVNYMGTRHGNCKISQESISLWKVTPRYAVKRLKPASLPLIYIKSHYFLQKTELADNIKYKNFRENFLDQIFFINHGVELEELVHFSRFLPFFNFYLNLCAA